MRLCCCSVALNAGHPHTHPRAVHQAGGGGRSGTDTKSLACRQSHPTSPSHHLRPLSFPSTPPTITIKQVVLLAGFLEKDGTFSSREDGREGLGVGGTGGVVWRWAGECVINRELLLISALNMHPSYHPPSPLSSSPPPPTAFPEDLPHQADACQEAKPEPTHPLLDPPSYRQHDPVQRQEASLASHQARPLNYLSDLRPSLFAAAAANTTFC